VSSKEAFDSEEKKEYVPPVDLSLVKESFHGDPNGYDRSWKNPGDLLFPEFPQTYQ
jgi:hypothetical protein